MTLENFSVFTQKNSFSRKLILLTSSFSHFFPLYLACTRHWLILRKIFGQVFLFPARLLFFVKWNALKRSENLPFWLFLFYKRSHLVIFTECFSYIADFTFYIITWPIQRFVCSWENHLISQDSRFCKNKTLPHFCKFLTSHVKQLTIERFILRSVLL